MENSKAKSIEFKQILSDISSVEPLNFDNDKKAELINQLINFYNQNERHEYSDIAEYIYSNPDEIEYLVSNLKELDKYCEDNDLKIKIFKILDHIKLEKIRLHYLEEESEKQAIHNRRSFSNISMLHASIRKLEDDTKKINEKVLESENKLNNFNAESIAILGIFSGIVMAFFGSMSFVNGVLNNINNVNIFKLSFIALIIGFILFNTIFLLIYSICKIVEKPIRSKCETSDCNSCEIKCSSIKKAKRTYPIVFYVNLFLITMTTIIVIGWIFEKLEAIKALAIFYSKTM